jgi:hypothetical protein
MDRDQQLLAPSRSKADAKGADRAARGRVAFATALRAARPPRSDHVENRRRDPADVDRHHREGVVPLDAAGVEELPERVLGVGAGEAGLASAVGETGGAALGGVGEA